MLEEFLEWFEGEYNNWTQAASWPSHYAHILLTHERLEGTKFNSNQRYKYNNEEYRHKEIEIVQRDDEIIALNPVADIHFRKEGDAYMGRNFKAPLINGGYLRSECILEKNKYTVMDRGFDDKGEQVWGSEYGAFVFDKQYK
jgi:hypothetical protein|tara:strand:- start:2697 stop:3122 length:426 start_codon:yes stop_codon:yes gene_type:complete